MAGTAPEGRSVNTDPAIPTAPWRTLKSTLEMQHWPPWWPLLLLLALAFAFGWVFRGILSHQ